MTPETTPSANQGTDASPAPFSLSECPLLARNKPLLLAALTLCGPRRATVSHVGVGDSGGVENVTFECAEGAVVDHTATVTVCVQRSHYQDGQWHQTLAEEEVAIDQALRDFTSEALDLVHGAWEDGEGATGRVIFDCESATVRIEHSAYFTEADYTETTL